MFSANFYWSNYTQNHPFVTLYSPKAITLLTTNGKVKNEE